MCVPLVDCAFSAELSDAAVESLVQTAIRMQRMNLRGCSAVSTSCYNQTPITLLKRSGQEAAAGAAGASVGAPAASPSEASCKLRKGDNVFFFTSR